MVTSPERLPGLDLLQHLVLELRRPEPVALARLLVEERRAGAHTERAHPSQQPLVRIAPRRAQDHRRPLPPARRDDHHAEPVGPEILRKGAPRSEPAADEAAAGLLRTIGVDRAATRAAEVARRTRLHLVA